MRIINSSSWASSFTSTLKDKVFGENFSRIDIFLNYFYNLRQDKRKKIIIYSIISAVLVFIFILGYYFVCLHNLQKDLDNAVYHSKELKNLQPNYMATNQTFSELTSKLKNYNQYNTIANSLDQKTKELGIDSTPLPEKPALIDLQSTDPLYPQFQKVKIEYKLLDVSLRKIIDYVNSIQNMPNKYKVTKIEIQQKLGSKLYFDVNLIVEAYVST